MGLRQEYTVSRRLLAHSPWKTMDFLDNLLIPSDGLRRGYDFLASFLICP